jgi:AAA family ATP:ADP antiporter
MKDINGKTASLSLRDTFWPIYGKEHRIWFPMASLVGLILFNYTVARNLKDSLVVTATASSEIIPYLKGALVLPASILFFFIYAKLANMVSKRTLFYLVVSSFMALFIFFALVLYPNHGWLHPTASADYLENLLPRGFKGLVDCYRIWTFSLFYVLSELWGVASVGLLFWQFANDVIKVADAKRFYAHFYLLANVFVALSGVVVARLADISKVLPEDIDYWGRSLTHLTFVMTACFLVILWLYFYLDRFVFTKAYFAEHNTGQNRDQTLKLSVKEGLQYLLKSKYLGLLASLLICYGITANLLEVAWKRQLVMVFKTNSEYAIFMGHLSTATGIGTIIAIFLGSIVIRKAGWLVAALATPVAVIVLGGLFFLAVIFPNSLAFLGEPFGWSPVLVAVNLGFMLEVVIKSIKYALFDPTKEMAYIPLEDEEKIRGKAAVDVVAGRFGKSSGGFFEITILAIAGAINAAMSLFAFFFAVFAVLWILAVIMVNRQFTKKCLNNF